MRLLLLLLGVCVSYLALFLLGLCCINGLL